MADGFTVSNFIDHELRDYSMYVIQERAIPSMVDGLKPSQRKALFAAIKFAKTFTKTAGLTGHTLTEAVNFHHGDASMNDTIANMAAEWNNNLPLLEGEGGFGNRFNKEPSAARYTKVRLHKNFQTYFLDNDILESHADPENPEPKEYLPIIPWVLVNGVSGIAVGFATNILPRNPKDLIKATQKILEGKKPRASSIKPWYSSFNGTIEWDDAKQTWVQVGTFERKTMLQLTITEIPTSYDREKYVKILDKLEDDGTINGYTDRSNKKSFCFDVKFPRGSKLDDAAIIKLFKLRQNLNENLTVINEHGKLETFDNPVDLVERFVAYRLQKIVKRYEHYIERDSDRLEFAEARLRFIRDVVNGTIVLKNKSKAQLTSMLISDKIYGKHNPNHVPKLIAMSISSFTSDEIKKLESEIQSLKEDIKVWKTTDPSDAYLTNLGDLK